MWTVQGCKTTWLRVRPQIEGPGIQHNSEYPLCWLYIDAGTIVSTRSRPYTNAVADSAIEICSWIMLGNLQYTFLVAWQYGVWFQYWRASNVQSALFLQKVTPGSRYHQQVRFVHKPMPIHSNVVYSVALLEHCSRVSSLDLWKLLFSPDPYSFFPNGTRGVSLDKELLFYHAAVLSVTPLDLWSPRVFLMAWMAS